MEKNMLIPFWQPTDTIVVAVSGGVDSMVLCHLILQQTNKQWQKKHIIIAHVNHFMRENALHDQAVVERFAKDNALIFEVNTHAPTLKNEAEARAFRYQFLKQIAQKYNANYIVTAHHQDDQVETILLDIIRHGSASRLLHIVDKQRMMGTNCQLVRPLLHVTKQQLLHYATQQRIPFVEDETNAQTHYTRNHLRHCVLPQLAIENDAYATHITQFAAELNDMNMFIDAFVTDAFKRCVQNMNVHIEALQQEQPLIQKRVLIRWLEQIGYLTHYNIKQLLTLLQQQNGQKQLQLSATHRIVKTYQHFLFEPIPKKDTQFATHFVENMSCQWCQEEQDHQTPEPCHHCTITLEHPLTIKTITNETYTISVQKHVVDDEKSTVVPLTMSDLPLQLTTKKQGDTIRIANGNKKIKRLFIDAKVPQFQRDFIPLLATKNRRIIAILKNDLHYLSKFQETVKIEQTEKCYVVIKRVDEKG